jgi:hypothetical protein
MSPLNRTSLCSTLDSLAESLFFQRRIPAAQRAVDAKWIASRQGLPGSYAGMFAPTEQDAQGIRLFTGEAVRSRVGIAHLLGEECCRILIALPLKDRNVQASLDRAVRGMSDRLEETDRRGLSTGIYCCGTCAAGYWRNLATGLFPRAEERLRTGLVGLKQLRCGDGQWRRFPFFYTCLALTEIGADRAQAEMQYAAERWVRILPRLSSAKDPFVQRRAAVGRRLLEMCEK